MMRSSHLSKRNLFYWLGDTGKGELYIVTQPKMGGCLARRYVETNGKEWFVDSAQPIVVCPAKIENKESDVQQEETPKV